MDIRETDAVRIRFHRWPDFFPARRRGALQVHSLSTLLRSPHEVSLFALLFAPWRPFRHHLTAADAVALQVVRYNSCRTLCNMTLSYEGVEAVLSEESVITNLMTLIQNETGPQTIQAVTAVLHNLAVERSSCLHRLFEDDGTCRAICELQVSASGSNLLFHAVSMEPCSAE